MKCQPRYMLAVFLLVCFCMVSLFETGAASEDKPSEPELMLLGMFNEARSNYRGASADHAENDTESVNGNGTDAMRLDQRLCDAAAQHSLDMFEMDYFSSSSPEGVTIKDRAREQGYGAFLLGERLGALAFGNFVSPADAVSVIYENMMNQEWKAAPNERTILNGNYVDVGISLRQGLYSVDGVETNAYFVVCVFGRSVESEREKLMGAERYLQVLINEFRNDPVSFIGSDSERDTLNAVVGLPRTPPLAWSEAMEEDESPLEYSRVDEIQEELRMETEEYVSSDDYSLSLRIFEILLSGLSANDVSTGGGFFDRSASRINVSVELEPGEGSELLLSVKVKIWWVSGDNPFLLGTVYGMPAGRAARVVVEKGRGEDGDVVYEAGLNPVGGFQLPLPLGYNHLYLYVDEKRWFVTDTYYMGIRRNYLTDIDWEEVTSNGSGILEHID